ncbi:MAG: VWA domain-containing protein [Verrucomicrobia bacterium]|nr:VWA domain-containing protein [Verrucomicrobiota bacterium]
MTSIFQHPEMLGLLVLPAAVALAVVFGGRWRKAALETLGHRGDKEADRQHTLLQWAMVGAGVLIVFALARPAWRPRTEALASDSRDVVFVLDVSRSMLARDRQPDRLSSARLAIRDLVEHLRPGDRVGLVVFAGSSLIVCPLTTDLLFFHKVLVEANPTSVTYGGTRIGDGLRKTADKLLGGAERRGFQDVILLTDGGDQESEIDKAVEAINDDGAALLVIGLGSDSEGARIPDGDGFVVYQGREIWSRQESATLEQIARRATTGLFLNAGTRAIDLPNVYRRFTEHSATTRISRRATDRREEEFPWFLGAALLTVLAFGGTIPRLRRSAKVAAAVGLSAGSSLASTPPPSAVPNLAENDFARDAARYIAAARAAPDATTEARNLYNAATCRLNEAAQIDEAAAQLAKLAKEAQARERAPAPANPPTDESDSGPADTATVLEQSIRLYETALQLTPNFPEAARNLEIARARWLKAYAEQEKQRQAAAAAEKEPSDARPSPDGEPSDEEAKNTDEDQANADKSKSGDSAKQPSDTSLADLLNRNIPPPNISPQDILRQEIENNQQRSAPNDPKAKAVEKNW